ncbi:TPA: hypothetical protein N0F65_009347 [Lagenidium giganteum]|uniref:LAGLIDADG endonuclease n=1 Tax=Lagenidium giganteum TaxID=4803 RepID=A0AAV2YMD2_9STRA|nr:TPA: hypothetical protein N0F65_009347 [Lagenidium giganteum]
MRANADANTKATAAKLAMITWITLKTSHYHIAPTHPASGFSGRCDFGVYNAGPQRQLNYVYSERKTGKVPNEVLTLLMSYLDYHELLEYMETTGGQNKNNFVVKLFVLHAQIRCLKRTHLKVFVRDHTKNSCNRGFGHIKRKLLHVGDLYDFNNPLYELYKNLPAIQKYQIFSVSSASPGMVFCQESPESYTHSFDIRRAYDNEKVFVVKSTSAVEQPRETHATQDQG